MDEKSLAAALKARGLDGIAATNFSNISHALWLKKQLPQYLIIVGQEVWSSKGHIGALGITRKIPNFRSPQETIEEIHRQGGLAVAHHPFLVMGLGRLAFDLPVDLIEGYNGMIGALWIHNFLAQRRARAAGRVCVSSTDTTAVEFIGQSRVEVMTDDRMDVLAALRAGRLRMIRRPMPVPVGFIARNFLGFRRLAPCRLHAAPCFLCGNSMTVRLFNRKVVCEDCRCEEVSRVACAQGHHFCIPCVMRRIGKADDAVDISRITVYPHGYPAEE